MSWSISRIGTKEKALAAADADLAKSQESYEKSNPSEANDIKIVRGIIADAVAVIDKGINGVLIEANGSRYSGCVTVHVSVQPRQVEL